MTEFLDKISKSRVRQKPLLLGLGFIILTLSIYGADVDARYAAGEKIYKANCATCHLPTDKINQAPGLKGANERWPNRELLYQWVQNPNRALATGDQYIKDIVKQYEPKFGIMTAQAVTPEEIEDVLYFVDNYVAPVKDVATGTAVTEVTAEPESNLIWWIILGLLFTTIILSLSGVNRALQSSFLQRQGKDPLPATSYGDSLKAWMWRNKTFVSVLSIFVVIYFLTYLYIAAMGVGVYTGYKPEQPINFSHLVHAGNQKIDCQYCHSGAQKSKTPLIPSANVCMNCHKAIQVGTTTGTEEIAKIYKATGWDVDSIDYVYPEEPINWIKVHDLPDHVYFNHAQHVKVAGLDCAECHGDVATMEIIEQVQPLTMAWCINCHNTTEVKMAGNGYYDEIHARLINAPNNEGIDLLKKYLEDGTITERELGGWECSKCHY